MLLKQLLRYSLAHPVRGQLSVDSGITDPINQGLVEVETEESAT